MCHLRTELIRNSHSPKLRRAIRKIDKALRTGTNKDVDTLGLPVGPSLARTTECPRIKLDAERQFSHLVFGSMHHAIEHTIHPSAPRRLNKRLRPIQDSAAPLLAEESNNSR